MGEAVTAQEMLYVRNDSRSVVEYASPLAFSERCGVPNLEHRPGKRLVPTLQPT